MENVLLYVSLDLSSSKHCKLTWDKRFVLWTGAGLSKCWIYESFILGVCLVIFRSMDIKSYYLTTLRVRVCVCAFCRNFQERNALFPGKTCFPLSADQPSSYSDALDQLNVIFDVIGTPSPDQIANLVRVLRLFFFFPMFSMFSMFSAIVLWFFCCMNNILTSRICHPPQFFFSFLTFFFRTPPSNKTDWLTDWLTSKLLVLLLQTTRCQEASLEIENPMLLLLAINI